MIVRLLLILIDGFKSEERFFIAMEMRLGMPRKGRRQAY